MCLTTSLTYNESFFFLLLVTQSRTNITDGRRLIDHELTWYYQSVTHRIYLKSFEYGHGIYIFKHNWIFFIIKLFEIHMKFLEPSGFNYTVIFPISNCFSCFHVVIAQLELEKHKFPNRKPSEAKHNVSA